MSGLGNASAADHNGSVAVQPTAQPRVADQAGALPRSLTPLVGRETEIRSAARLVGEGQRLLTLCGPAGVGKTRLSTAIADATTEHFPDGQVFVSLARIVDPALVPAIIAADVGVRDLDTADLVGALTSRLDARRVLLILDNFEHVLSSAPLLSELLVRCPGVSVMATSRSPLRLAGERLVPVLPLGLPDKLHSHTDEVARCDAVRLFIARAEAACGDFELTADNALSVVDICRRLDGLPLALELAAARLRVLPPQALAERLESGLGLLSEGARDAPPRLRTMRDAIAWSYALLPLPLQALFRRLSVFVGGWSLDALEAVCLWDLGELDALDGLSTLLDHSLVRRAVGDASEPRYEMLHVVREFATERLVVEGEQRTVERACAAYLGRLARQVGAARGTDRERGHVQVSEEIDNIRAILSWSLSDAAERADVDLALEIAGHLWFYWIHYSRAPGEALSWLTRALAAAPPTSSTPRARALVALGALEWRQGEYGLARQHLDQSTDMLRKLNDAQGLGYGLHLAGHVCFEARQYAEARLLYEQSRQALAEAGDGLGDLPLIGDLGMVAYHLGDYDHARTLFESCLRQCREHGVRDHAADCLNRLGDLARLAGDLSRAEAYYTESLTLWRGLRGTPGIASSLHKLAQIARRRGNLNEAYRLLVESVDMQIDIRNKQGMAECLAAFAGLALQSAPGAQALELLVAAEAVLANLGAPLAPVDARDFEADRERGKALASDRSRAQAERRGRALSLTDALALARSELVSRQMSARQTSPSTAPGGLSPRELEVVNLIARGLSNREISSALTITEKTAANHVEHIMTKLDLRSRAQVAVWAVQQDRTASR